MYDCLLIPFIIPLLVRMVAPFVFPASTKSLRYQDNTPTAKCTHCALFSLNSFDGKNQVFRTP